MQFLMIGRESLAEVVRARQSALPNPRSALHCLCQTSRDFVPWSLSDAGHFVAWTVA
jgi:hypothetical protein